MSANLVDIHGKPLMSIGSPDSKHYAASYSARELCNWNPTLNSADDDIIPEIDRIHSRAIDLDRNNGVAHGARETSTDHVIGTGLNLLPEPNWRVLGRSREWASEWGKEVKAHYNDFAESRLFDAAGKLNNAAMTRQLYKTEYTQGAALVIPMWKTRAGHRYKSCFKSIDPTRLCNPPTVPESVRCRGGIKRDADGEVIGYWIRNKLPSIYEIGPQDPNEWTYIPAFTKRGRQRVIHIYRQDRPGQSRGVARATAVLAAFGLAGQYQLTELQAAVVNSKIAGFLESDLPPEIAAEIIGSNVEEYTEMRSAWRGQLSAGAILNLPIGTKFNSHITNRPASGYADYMEQIYTEIGVGIGLPRELLMRDFSKSNYSSARAAMLEALRGFMVERSHVATEWLNITYALWLEEAVDKQIIEAEDFYQYKSAYCRARWLGLGHQPIDPVKHQQSITEGLTNKSLTLARVYAEQGLDWEDELEQVAREDAKLRELGLSITENQPSARNESTDPDDMTDDEINAELRDYLQEIE